MRDRDLVAVRIRKAENVQDTLVGILFTHRNKIKPDVFWGVLGRSLRVMRVRAWATVSKSLVRVPAAKGKFVEKTKEWS